MKITTENYFETVRKIQYANLPIPLKEAHTVITVKTDVGRDWNLMKQDEHFKSMVTTAFKKLEEFVAAQKPGLDGVRPNPYAEIGEEVRFIRLFLTFHDDIIRKNTFGIFLDELKDSIEAKKIRKTSPVAKDIMDIQRAALKQFNTMRSAKYFVLKPATIKRLNGILEKWENSVEVSESYLKEKKREVDLQGIQVQAHLEPAKTEPATAIMSSETFAKTEFKTIGFTGKWLKLMGDPSQGFKAMVFGMPKMGKSYLCVDFASYLSKNHGKVLYISKEEFLSPTLALKIKEKNAANPNLDIAGALPTDLSAYQFVFLDSVTSLKLKPDDLKLLEQMYPTVSFIYVFQVTKAGSARGTNEYMHNVDIVIEIPERGKAVQFGRFNQGGQMDIFDSEEEESEEPEQLFGIK